MSVSIGQLRCPLCGSGDWSPYHEDQSRPYHCCAECRLVYVPCGFWLAAGDEKAVYDLHENDPDDPGYRRFLSRLSAPLLKRLEPNQQGLDFGCGPGPGLPGLLEVHGHAVDLYDPIYFNDPSVFHKQYDFICAAEVAEHLREPGKTFEALFRMLRPEGWLGIMTKLVIDQQAFRNWHYIRDRTHIAFYSRSTFAYLAERFHADVDFIGSDVILLNKRY